MHLVKDPFKVWLVESFKYLLVFLLLFKHQDLSFNCLYQHL
jgi:hypothetical protein